MSQLPRLHLFISSILYILLLLMDLSVETTVGEQMMHKILEVDLSGYYRARLDTTSLEIASQ